MDKHSLDKLFKNKLQHYERSPQPDSWDKLEFLMDEQNEATAKKKKRRAIWLSIAASVCILLIGSWVIFSQLKQHQDGNTPEFSKNPIENDSLHQEKNLAEDTNSGDTHHLDTNSSESKQKLIQDELPIVERNQMPFAQSGSPKNLNKQGKNPDQKTKQKLLQEKTQELKDKSPQVEKQILEDKTMIADNQNKTPKRKGYKIVVKVKFKKRNPPQETPQISDDYFAQQDNPLKKRKNRKLFGKKKGDKNGKILGIDPEKVWASIGK